MNKETISNPLSAGKTRYLKGTRFSYNHPKVIWIVIFWVMTPCSLVSFGGTFCLRAPSYSEDGEGNLFRNVGNHVPDYTVS
jgi:hypothetical protein